MTQPAPVPELRSGRYQVLGTLGVGSQAETLDGIDKRDGTAVAIKRFFVRGAKSWKEVELAEREASVLSGLSHPNLPVYVEHFEEDGALYLVMRKIEGETLSALRKRGGSLGADELRRFLSDADSALHYLHSRIPPIIDRDLKPGNVIRRPDGGFAFVDFGSVRDRLKPEGGSTVVGTFGYMAPEQFQGRALPASDVYAIGATLLALVTGQEPEDLPHRGLAIDVARALDGAAPAWLERALTAMLEPDPDRRASRIAPLLSGDTRPSYRAAGGAQRIADEARRMADDMSRDVVERALDDARRSVDDARRVRRDRRSQRRQQRRAGRAGPPFPIAAFFLIGLAVARIATFALFRVFLPVLLTLLWQRNAARRCQQIGISGERGLVYAMSRVHGHVLRGQEEPPDPQRSANSARLRVEPEPHREAGESDDDRDDRDDPERRKHRL